MAQKSDGEFYGWLQNVTDYYSQLSDAERNLTIDYLIANSGSSQLLHLFAKTTELLHRDFLKLLPVELREYLLSYIDGKSILTCCCVSKTWNEILSSSSRVWQQACQRSGLIVSKDVDNVEAMYWKSFFLEMTKRRHEMVTYKCFSTKSYEKFLRRVTAVYYYKGKIATATDSKIIQIWDCATDACLMTLKSDSSVSSIKFDDCIILASSYLGHMVSWDFASGERLSEYMRHCGAIFSFDYSLDLNIVVSGSADRCVKIWELSGGNLKKTLTDHSWWVLKVILTSYPADKDSRQKNRHLLFSMDKTTIFVRLMSLVTGTLSPEGLYISTLYSIMLQSTNDSFSAPGLHFDGEFLYFTKESLDNRGYNVLCKWDVRKGCMISETDLNIKVKALLGVGQKYVALLTPLQDKTAPNFIVIDKETNEKVAFWKMPPSKPSIPDCSELCLGEASWLDGLDGKNDQGVIFISAVEDNCVYILKWTPKDEKQNAVNF